jgi:hypothetical protein
MKKSNESSENLVEISVQESNSHEKSISSTVLRKIEAELYAVIRSKGGSGEKHLVKKLAKELLASNKKVIICYQIPMPADDLHLTHFLPVGINNLIKLKDIQNDPISGVLNLDWGNEKQLAELLLTIAGFDNLAIIFTIGTFSGAGLFKRVESVEPICKKIFISITSSCDYSIERARNLCLSQYENNKIHACCWYRSTNTLLNKYEYKLKSFNSSEFADYSNEEVSNMSNSGEEILLLM